MKPTILAVLLGLSTVFAGMTLYSRRPRRLVMGWLAVGVLQSVFLLVVGFEFLALLNLLFAAASGLVLQIYSALFGTGATYEAERKRDRRDWIYGIGSGATMVGVLLFAFVSTFPSAPLSPDLETATFAKEILNAFPELPWVIGVVFFLGIVLAAAVGRPGWKRSAGGAR